MKNKLQKQLTMEERIRLAEEWLDIYERDARIFPPPVYVNGEGFPENPGKVLNTEPQDNGRYIKVKTISEVNNGITNGQRRTGYST